MSGRVGSPAKPKPRRGISPTYLVVDTREDAVIPFLDDALTEHTHLVKQVCTGDYLVCRARGVEGHAYVLACVERKTLTDFAQSFIDGRYEGEVKKMLKLRETCSSQLFFFIEGPAFPSPNRKFSRIPYSSILTAITNLMVRDGIYVIYTEDQAHTAKRLSDLLRSFDDKIPLGAETGQLMEVKKCLVLLPAGAEQHGGGDRVRPGGSETTLCLDGGDLVCAGVPDVLLQRVEQTESEIAVTMWARLSGVSIVLGKVLTRVMSVADLACGWVDEPRVRGLKTQNGKAIGKTAVDSLLAVRGDVGDCGVKLVSGIRGVSPAVAQVLVAATGGLRPLCGSTPEQLARIELPQKNRTAKLGLAKAKQILAALHYKDTAHMSAEQLGQTIGGSEAATPEAATPKVTIPKAATPKVTIPKAATPKAATPKAAIPKAATPKAVALEAKVAPLVALAKMAALDVPVYRECPVSGTSVPQEDAAQLADEDIDEILCFD